MITIGIDANSLLRWTFIFNDEHEALCARAKMLANIEKCEHEVTLHHLIRGIVVKFIPPFKLTDSKIYIFTRAELDTCFEKFELKPGIDPLSKTKVLSVNAPRINYAKAALYDYKTKGDTVIFDECAVDAIRYAAELFKKKEEPKLDEERSMDIEKVIFSPPATIVIWKDKTKTVVKCGPDDKFNPHVGIAMCVMKRVYGGRYIEVGRPDETGAQKVIWADNFHSIFRKWADPWVKKQEKEAYKPSAIAPDVILKGLSDRMNIALDNYWKNILKNFESASDDQKAEDDKEK